MILRSRKFITVSIIVFLMCIFLSTKVTFAAVPSSLEEVNSFLYTMLINDSRTMRLLNVGQPDMIQRGIFEWVGTQFSERQWQGATEKIDELHNRGSLVMGGVSGLYWAPTLEKGGPATINQATIDRCSIDTPYFPSFVKKLDITQLEAKEHLIWKAKKQIDAGCDGIDIDEFGTGSDYEYVKNTLNYIATELKSYGQTQYGRKIYISTNSTVGGQDLPAITGSTNDGSEAVDYYQRSMPYKLVNAENSLTGLDSNGVLADFDGTYNFIPALRTAHSKVLPKRFFYFLDFGGYNQYWAPHKKEQWVNWYRISSAQVIAAGGFPGIFRSYYNSLDMYQSGVLPYVNNLGKFMKENSVLWHNLSFITPKINAPDGVNTSAFNQNDRTILHLVNNNYDNTTQTMKSKTNFKVKISLLSRPQSIWMTTPDKPAKDRSSNLSFTYSKGVATILVPELDFHNVIVIGNDYNPTYSDLSVVFPFPVPDRLPVNNSFKIDAIATDGFDGTFNWYVNGISGGNSTFGTIDANGVFTAPATVPSPDTVTIKAVSRIDTTKSNEVSIKIVPSNTLPWTYDFSNQNIGSIPSAWYLNSGRGDWKIDTDASEKVLRNNNISEGFGDGSLFQTALYSPFIVTGDQSWTNYQYSLSVKLNSDPIYMYGMKGGTLAGAVFRYKDSKNYYFYSIDGENKVRLMKVYNSGSYELGQPVDTTFALSTNEYLNMRVQVYGQSFRLFINNVLVREDSDQDITTGAVGIIASFIDANYKDVNVNPSSAFDVVVDDGSKINSPYAYQKSNNLVIDSSNAYAVGNDYNRYCRTQASEEWITYNISSSKIAKITSYFWPDEPISHYKFYVSADNSNWTEVTPTRTSVGNGIYPEWKKVVYEFAGFPTGNQYLKVMWQNTTGQSWSPQLSQVEIKDSYAYQITDDASTLSNLFAHSINAGVDYSNPQLMEGDIGRFCRMNGSTGEEYLTYHYQKLVSAKVSSYFYPFEERSHFKFYVSNNNSNWTEVTPTIDIVNGVSPTWDKVTYDFSSFSEDSSYFKIVWQNPNGQSWSPQISQVQINYSVNNIVKNFGFEEGNYFWDLPASFTVSTEQYNKGSKALKLVGTGSNSYATQTVAVRPNTDYKLTFNGKCDKQTWYQIITTAEQSLAIAQTSANNTWSQYTLSFNSGNNTEVKIYVGDTGETIGGTQYFDDFEIK